MKIVINPYVGYSDNLANSIVKFGGTLEKPKCVDGLCPIPVQVKLMTKKKINELVQAQQKKYSNEPFDLIIVSLTEKDQLTLVKMSRNEKWGSLQNVNVQIVCDLGI
jgi:adenine-specific DNA glycosylase